MVFVIVLLIALTGKCIVCQVKMFLFPYELKNRFLKKIICGTAEKVKIEASTEEIVIDNTEITQKAEELENSVANYSFSRFISSSVFFTL